MPYIAMIRRILFLRYDPFEFDFAGFLEYPNTLPIVSWVFFWAVLDDPDNIAAERL